MTYAEIIKALELCFTEKGTTYTCAICPYHSFGELCKVERDKDALDLIKRQKAEIETLTARIGIYETCNARKDEAIYNLESKIARLQNILLRFMDEVAKWEYKHGLDVSELPLIPICDERRSIIDHHRTEAIKEFAERLKEHKYQSSDWSHGEHPFVVEEDDIDSLVKEMEGDTE